jgi:hypothetical protein
MLPRDTYSDEMVGKGFRLVGLLAVAALGAWWGRLIAHSKKPAAEGRWRELTDDELS